MNYQKHYNLLINRARNRLLEEYTEKHHIIPRCMNGTNDVENIISLTPEEHYVAHQLLIKIYPKNRKLIHAAQMMTVGSSNQSRNNKLYGWLRKKYSESCKKRIPWNKGLKTGPQSKEHILKRTKTCKGRSSPMKGKIPWNKGLSSPMIGIPRTLEVKNKISTTQKIFWGNMSENEKQIRIEKNKVTRFKKGRIPWNKGIKLSEEHRKNISIGMK